MKQLVLAIAALGVMASAASANIVIDTHHPHKGGHHKVCDIQLPLICVKYKTVYDD